MVGGMSYTYMLFFFFFFFLFFDLTLYVYKTEKNRSAGVISFAVPKHHSP